MSRAPRQARGRAPKPSRSNTTHDRSGDRRIRSFALAPRYRAGVPSARKQPGGERDARIATHRAANAAAAPAFDATRFTAPSHMKEARCAKRDETKRPGACFVRPLHRVTFRRHTASRQATRPHRPAARSAKQAAWGRTKRRKDCHENLRSQSAQGHHLLRRRRRRSARHRQVHRCDRGRGIAKLAALAQRKPNATAQRDGPKRNPTP